MKGASFWQRTLSTKEIIVSIWLAAVLLVGLTGYSVILFIENTYAREYASSLRDLGNLTRVAQEHAVTTFRNADQVVKFLRSRFLASGDKLDLAQLTQEGIVDAVIFNQVGIAAPSGQILLSSRIVSPMPNISDREHFRVHLDSDTVGLFISKPVLGRVSHRWSVQLSRRIAQTNGAFAGVAVVSIDVGYFTSFYKDLQLGHEGVIALYGLDGVARARKVGELQDFGSIVTDDPMFTRIAQGEQSGSYTRRSPVDGIERLYHFRRVPGYNLAVTAGLATEELRGNVRRACTAVAIEGALLSVLIVALAFALMRYLTRVRRATEARVFAQNQVEDRTQQLDVIFALSPDGFVSFDREMRVKYVNPAFRALTALNEQSLEGMTEAEFFDWLALRCSSETQATEGAQLHRQLTGDKEHLPQALELADPVKTNLQVTLRLSKAQTVSQILYFRDVTRETELDELKSEFLATAAHELRSPMAIILGFSELLISEAEPQTQQEFLQIVHAQSLVMVRILDELLDLAQIEARRNEDFTYVLLDLQTLCRDIFKSLPISFGRTTLTWDMPEEPIKLRADSGKLRQVILNVLTNAYKYSPDGGSVSFALDLIQLPGLPVEARMQFTDQGIGMTEEQSSRIFERFYRADKSGTIPGTGLGMSLVREIITLHNGHVEVDSTLGKGTCVRMFLPLAQF